MKGICFGVESVRLDVIGAGLLLGSCVHFDSFLLAYRALDRRRFVSVPSSERR